jgi:hypothetical protein
MLRTLRFAALGVAFLISGAADAQQPIRNGDTLTGTLRLVRTTHPNGTRIEAYQIVSEPRAMPADDEFCTSGKGVTTFHLFAMTDATKKQLKPLIGKPVSVKATTLFCSQTAWHIGDVAVPEWQLLAKP